MDKLWRALQDWIIEKNVMTEEEKKAYLEFLEYSIDSKKALPDSVTNIDWYDFLQFCNRQGIIGLVFEGIQKADIRINQNILFQWLSYAEQIKQQNIIANQRIGQVQHFFDEKNCRTCILKGQANGLMYPKPEVRSPGDIDIWVEGDTIDIIKMVQGVVPNASYSLHHIKMPVFKDVSVEVHYRPANMTSRKLDKRLQAYVKEVADDQFSNKVKLEEIEIGSLTNEFNALYQILHMYGHFFATRNSFKQFVDYYYLLKKGLTDDEKKHCLKMFGQLKIEKYSAGIMWIMTDVLGLDERFIIGEKNEREGRLILDESFYYGTFSKRAFQSVLEQTMANARIVSHYTGEVLGLPFYLVWHQWWKFMMRQTLKK